jgi:hypothetical protein
MRRGPITTLALLALAVGGVAPAGARDFETIVQDDALLLHADEAQIKTGLERARTLGISRVRLTAGWSTIAPEADLRTRPVFDARDPGAYPADNWRNLDRAVRLTVEAGLAPMIDIAFWAPRWATKDDGADRLATEVDPAAYADFATAVATRYSGSWTPPLVVVSTPALKPSPDRTFLEQLFGTPAPDPVETAKTLTAPREPLPGVDLFTIWNEPNHPGFLRPQWVKRSDGSYGVRSAELYRAMVRAAYPAIKAAAPGATVLIGGTASMGSSTPGQSGVPPLKFLRALACVDDALQPVSTGDCAGYTTLPGDGYAHHPYSLRTTPDVDTRDLDKLPLAATRRTLVERGRLARGAADLWLTEYGYETNAPDPEAPFSLAAQSRLLAWAEYLGTRDAAVRSWPQFQLYDRPNESPRPGMREFGDWQSGLYFADGSPKPSAATFSAPVFAACVAGRAGGWVAVWGRLRTPAPGTTAEVQQRAGGTWRTVATFDRPSRSAKVGRASVATAPVAAITRYARHRRGAAYRLRWSGSAGERLSTVARPATAKCRRRAATAAARR